MSQVSWKHVRADNGKLCVFHIDEVRPHYDGTGLFDCKCGLVVNVQSIDLAGKRKQENPFDLIQDDIHQADILKQEGI